MAEISALTGSIIKEAEEEAQKIIDSSKEKAQEIAEKISKTQKELFEKLKKEADTKNDLENKSFESEKRKIFENTLSAARIEFYGQVIDEAKNILKSSPPDTHLSFIKKTLEKLNIPDNSKISLSAKISDSEADKICKKFNLKKGEKLNDFGFIITTPSYTENYTPDSIFEEKRADFIRFLHLRPEVK